MYRYNSLLGKFFGFIKPSHVSFPNKLKGIRDSEQFRFLATGKRFKQRRSGGCSIFNCQSSFKGAKRISVEFLKYFGTSDDSKDSNLCNKDLKKHEVSKGSHDISESSYRAQKDQSQKNESEGIFKYILMLVGVVACASGLYVYMILNPESSSKIPEVEIKKTITRKKKRSAEVIKNPTDSAEIPTEVPYLLIGGGTASFSAFRAIKSIDPKAKVLVVSDEQYNPYMRPPLSKEMWYSDNRQKALKLEFKQWNGTERSLFYEPNDFYTPCSTLLESENGGVAVAQGWTVKSIDVENRKVRLDDGKLITYDKCLIATGATPKNLPIFNDLPESTKEKVMLYRGISDFKELEYTLEDGAKSIVVIGGGFLGSELACALSRRGRKDGVQIIQIFKEDGNMRKVLPQYLSNWTTKKVEAEGVHVIKSAEVKDYIPLPDSLQLILSDGRKIEANKVILAVGVEPNTNLARLSGLEVDPEHGGFLVNAELEARSNVYAAGDCACFYDVKLGRRRVEHHDQAVVSGRLAGENMTGAGKPYLHQSMFWSDLGPDVGYEAIGIIDSTLPTVGVFVKASVHDTPKSGMVDPKSIETSVQNASIEEDNKLEETAGAPKPGNDYSKGVIFYLKDDIVVGIVLWNVFNRMSIARQVIKDEKKYEDLNELAKLFHIHG